MKSFPRYVRLSTYSKCALRLMPKKSNEFRTYYRDAGGWDCRATWVNGKLLITDDAAQLNHLNGSELVPTTKSFWTKDNGGYI